MRESHQHFNELLKGCEGDQIESTIRLLCADAARFVPFHLSQVSGNYKIVKDCALAEWRPNISLSLCVVSARRNNNKKSSSQKSKDHLSDPESK
jgi:hypothetical protein